jgi:retron-type reverse transcriptase
MQPVEAAREWGIPRIESALALAEWLGVELGELEWFADLKGLAFRKSSPQLHHYHYRILAKGNGGVRLIEAPKPRLKDIQRQILKGILERIPAHPAAHGFVKGRSIKTFVTPHVSRCVVLRMDLQDFFPSFRAGRIQSFFRTLGYPETVADLLGGVCTNATPRRVWKKAGADIDLSRLQDARIMHSRPHLPQGAPTSPMLASLCTYRVDCRLAGLATRVGANYTRYADDIAFSGDKELEQRIERFSTHVAAILLDEGFNVHFRKTRIMKQGVRQRLAGLVVNQHTNVIRSDYDRLKATLTNCTRHGPESQNRHDIPHFRLHLEGRVAFVEMVNPARGARLRRIFNQIRWE